MILTPEPYITTCVSGFFFSRIPSHPITHSTLQPKFMVGNPGDIYEQEANRAAAQVKKMDDLGALQPVQREMSSEKNVESFNL